MSNPTNGESDATLPPEDQNVMRGLLALAYSVRLLPCKCKCEGQDNIFGECRRIYYRSTAQPRSKGASLWICTNCNTERSMPAGGEWDTLAAQGDISNEPDEPPTAQQTINAAD